MKSSLCTLSLLLFLNSTVTTAEEMDSQGNISQGKTVMAIFAHPDDEAIALPLMAKYAREGADVRLVIATDGQKGVQPHTNIPAGKPLAQARAKETLCTTDTLNIAPPVLLNYVDGELNKRENLYQLNQDIARLFSEVKPDVVITWGPDGGYGHSDHRLVGSAVTAIFQQGGESWPEMVFYPAIPEFQSKDFPEAKTRVGQYMQSQWGLTEQEFLPYRVSYEQEDFDLARQAYSCNASQFTEEEMNDLFNIISKSEGVAYLRPSHVVTASKESLFQ
jgi:LmbE family N-acetylglucosaminyl deacetylase